MRFIVGLLLFAAVVALSNAVPVKRNLVYIEQPNAASYYGAPARLMYIQSVQPSSPYARSQQGVEAFVAGGSVAAGSYLENGVEQVELEASQGINNEEILSVAEAYPDQPQVDVDFQATAEPNYEVNDDAQKTPIGVPKEAREYNFDAPAVDLPPANENVPENEGSAPPVYNTNETPLAEFDPQSVVTEPSFAAPEAPVNPTESVNEEAPARRVYSAKKKIFVELETPRFRDSNQGDNNEEDGEILEEPVRPPKAAKKPVKDGSATNKPATPLPNGSFFPINFGGTSGGAIAIANSFSTGEGGSATSHAIAYGAPGAARPTTRSRKN